MYVALRTFRYRNTSYAKGDTVPAEGWTARRALVASRRIRYLADPGPLPPDEPAEPEPPEPTVTVETDGQGGEAAPASETPTGAAVDFSALTRAELNAYAATLGVADPDSYPNKGALVDAIEEALTAPDGGEDGA
jgi:hypothetical protein